jgi:hypothetical protein
MWSLGCVTVVALTGAPPFRHTESFSFSESQARQCDLGRLREDPDWMAVGDRPKDFVYRLIVLDETKRMDAKTALGHTWFTNPKHKSQLDAVYRRAIRDWKPRAVREPVVVNIDLGRKQTAEQLDQVQWQAIRSDQSIYFRSTGRSVPCKRSFNPINLQQSATPFPVKLSCTTTSKPSATEEPTCQRIASPTLSDPDFPVEEEKRFNIPPKQNKREKRATQLNPRKEQSRKKYKYQNGDNNINSGQYPPENKVLISAPRQSNQDRHRPCPRLCLHRLPFSPQAWTWKWSDGNSDGNSDSNKNKKVVVQGKRLPGDAQKTHCQARPKTNDSTTAVKKEPTKAAKTTTTTMTTKKHQPVTNQAAGNNENLRMTTTLGRKRRIDEVYSRRPEADEEEEEDEIYEEVENPFSNKIYRVIYGTRNCGGV